MVAAVTDHVAGVITADGVACDDDVAGDAGECCEECVAVDADADAHDTVAIVGHRQSSD